MSDDRPPNESQVSGVSSEEDIDKIEISLGFGAENLDPHEVTATIGLSPSHSYKRGDEYQSRGGHMIRRPWGLWQYSTSGRVPSNSVEDHARFLWDQLRTRRAAIEKVRSQPGVYCDLRIWLEVSDCVASFALPSEILLGLCSLCQDVNLSIITTPPEDRSKAAPPGNRM